MRNVITRSLVLAAAVSGLAVPSVTGLTSDRGLIADDTGIANPKRPNIQLADDTGIANPKRPNIQLADDTGIANPKRPKIQLADDTGIANPKRPNSGMARA